MLGAIIGDIVGSVYEWNNIKTKDFPLFREDCFFTDDTVMTIAAAEAVMKGGSEADFIEAYKTWGRRYPNAGYGGKFSYWLTSGSNGPYNSFGNGSAMRVSPAAWMMNTTNYLRAGVWPSEGLKIVTNSSKVTHNHPKGIRGAQATATAIFFCRTYREQKNFDSEGVRTTEQGKARIKELIEKLYAYDLSRTLDEIRPTYQFNESCQETVPQAIIAFLESTDFEDAIRNAISLGGDSDTVAAITGSIAEAYYGIPDWIKKKALTYLDPTLREVLHRWKLFLPKNH